MSMTAVVERHDAAPGCSQRLNPTRVDPVDAMVGGEAVNEQDGLAKIAAERRDVDERDVDAVRRKMPEFGAPAAFVPHVQLVDAPIETTVRTFA